MTLALFSLRRSLRRRLLGWLLIATAIIGMVALVDTWQEAVNTANTVSDRVLAGSALAIAERVVVAEDGSLEVDIPYVALEMLTSAAQDRVFYRVDGPPGTFITGYQSLPVVTQRPGEAAAFEDATFRGEPIRVGALQRSASTGISSVPFVVTVAETTIARRQLAQAILLRSAARLLVMIAGAAVIVWIAVTISLRPLNRLGAAIAERNPDDLQPIREEVPREVEGLVETVNSFMVRLSSALEALRHFTGNASHQLRTPLAVIRTQLALVSRAGTLEEAREAAAKSDAAVARAERVLAQFLTLARLNAAASGEAGALAPVDLLRLSQDVTADHVPAAAAAGIDLGFEGEGSARVAGEPLLLGELVKNLIDNAIAYAGHGAEVTVKVEEKAGAVLLSVTDDGPGIAPERRAEVMRRFVRGAREKAFGSGLGLPIVEEIAMLHGAAVTLDDGAVNRKTNRYGLKVSVRFPPVGAVAPGETPLSGAGG
ncbi:two-component system, OmpR family, sensor histidine kinase TctE [Rhizobium sp. RU20A]|uniref:sensor histidine kinase n=1 Tax=Rhizobium sp. RU20A TaxID=1907412 RepID=UPI000955341E|nr:sensor histidine kinase [Rhizobium sp. RU20A]SIR27503.1 two-component system, OmpR family, sensor histidine kinase TctE [Rhizobium sp. RU20A]